MENPGAWNQQTLQTVQVWRNQVLSRGTAHEAAMARYKRLGRMVTVPCVVLSAILGSAGVTSLADRSEDEAANRVQSMWVSIASMMIAGLTALNATLNLDVKGNQHGQASRSYLRLSRMIDVQLARTDSEREPSAQFMDRLVFAMDNLRETSPAIDEQILKHFPALVDNYDKGISQQFPVINFVAQAPKHMSGSFTTQRPLARIDEPRDGGHI